MALSLTPAARAFDQSARTTEDLKTFWNAEPREAAAWLAEVAGASSNAPPELLAASEAFRKNASLDELEQLVRTAVTANPTLLDAVGTAMATAHAQTQGAGTIGWTAAPAAPTPVAPAGAAAPSIKPEPAVFVGHLQRTAEGVIQFKTSTGTFDVDLTRTNWREELETTFLRDRQGNPQLLTMKGLPSNDGKRFYVDQFAPGATADFFSGRVKVEGDKVFIETAKEPDSMTMERIELTHPELKKLLKGDGAQLASFQPAGMILPGKVNVAADGTKSFDALPEGFFILGRTMKLNVASENGFDYHDVDTGYFKATTARSKPGLIVPPQSSPGGAVWDAGDTTKGSTKDTEGPRAFFFAKILPHEEPRGPAMPRPGTRFLEISAVSDQGDYGKHSAAPTGVVHSQDFGIVARFVPASAPEHTPAQGSIDPSDD